MGLREEKRIDKRMFNYSAGCYCGVLVPTNVMRKLAKLHEKYTSDIRQLLYDSKDELMIADWTLANEKEGKKIKKQVIVHYALKEHGHETIESRIKLFKTPRPVAVEEVFLVDSREEAQLIADEILQSELEEEKNHE